jgi:hypothetical protein
MNLVGHDQGKGRVYILSISGSDRVEKEGHWERCLEKRRMDLEGS